MISTAINASLTTGKIDLKIAILMLPFAVDSDCSANLFSGPRLIYARLTWTIIRFARSRLRVLGTGTNPAPSSAENPPNDPESSRDYVEIDGNSPANDSDAIFNWIWLTTQKAWLIGLHQLMFQKWIGLWIVRWVPTAAATPAAGISDIQKDVVGVILAFHHIVGLRRIVLVRWIVSAAEDRDRLTGGVPVHVHIVVGSALRKVVTRQGR